MQKIITSLFHKLIGRDNTKKGTVKFYNSIKGFGFIKEQSGQEVFVHATGLVDKIRTGDQVQFTLETGEKGPSAINVKVIA